MSDELTFREAIELFRSIYRRFERVIKETGFVFIKEGCYGVY